MCKVWILEFGDFGFWILGILDFGFWGFWILDFGDLGFWILDWGFWMGTLWQNFGCYIRKEDCARRTGSADFISFVQAIVFFVQQTAGDLSSCCQGIQISDGLTRLKGCSWKVVGVPILNGEGWTRLLSFVTYAYLIYMYDLCWI